MNEKDQYINLPEESDLTFNIVFTPDAFRLQSIFLFSLLENLQCSFRIVANGCVQEEIEQMKSFCSNYDRLEIIVLPFSKMLHHSYVLSWLQKKEMSDYFCFMDSDILATGNYLTSMIPLLKRYSAVFSGMPIWQEEGKEVLPPSHHRVMGRYITNIKGLFLGCSYLAIYDNHDLNRVRKNLGIGFDRQYWRDLSPHVRLLLVKMGMPAQFYDTSKVLNILMQEDGMKLVQHESDYLHHIGGLSSGVLRGPQGHIHPSYPPPKETYCKRVVNTYFLELLEALLTDRSPVPVPEIRDNHVLKRIHSVRESLISCVYEFKNQV